ncbi:MAG: hypothetical protein PHR28_10830 [candidate division Zixibacteria bacterium]|nr:hypothetical protein [candidate division Zixibacteria bacterium]
MSKKQFITVALVVLTTMSIAAPAMAENRPIQLALFAPIQIFPERDAISGIRLSLIYGKNTSVTGLDWGLVNHTTSGVSTAAQFGLVGLADADFVGWQDNAINIVNGNFEGLQWGLVNYANHAKGLQLGFVNYARTLNGLQIGLVNIIKQGGAFPVFPIVNWSF